MKTIVLTQNQSIEIVLQSAKVTADCDIIAAWADNTGNSFTEGGCGIHTNGTATVTAIQNAGEGVRRIIKSLNLFNADSAPVTATIRLNDNGTYCILAKVTLNERDSWTLEGCFDLSGSFKGIGKDGINGREVEFQVSETGILQWRYVGTETYIDLDFHIDLHNPVTIAEASKDYASIDENQILTINKQTVTSMIEIENITYLNLLTKIEASNLTPGGFYFITDRGDKGLLFQAVESNKLSPEGIRFMLCPSDYGIGQRFLIINYSNLLDGVFEVGERIIGGNDDIAIILSITSTQIVAKIISETWTETEQIWSDVNDTNATIDSLSFSGPNWIGVWHSTKTASINDLTIWNGLVWKCIAEVTGPLDPPSSNTINWHLIPKNSFENGEYVELIFGCSYDVENDWICRQWDKKGNVFGQEYAIQTQIELNYCDCSDWNCSIYDNSFVNNKCDGIFNNTTTVIYNNTCEVIRENNVGSIYYNYIDGEISNNNLTDGGEIFGNKCAVIYNNNNSGFINGNALAEGQISRNSNSGNISGNTCEWSIMDNSNSGSISYNSNSYAITNNSNVGTIEWNCNNGSISANSNNGNIVRNRNNGEISNNSSAPGTSCNIYYNNNNGHIQNSVRTTDVTDPLVSK